MNIPPENPYSPPTTTSKPVPHQSTKKSILLPTSLVVLLTIAYLTFTIVCLSSGGVDRQAGKMLIFNAPLLLGWIGLLLRSSPYSTTLGYAVPTVQALIMLSMLFRKIGEPSVVLTINGMILVGQGLIALTCHWIDRRTIRHPST